MNRRGLRTFVALFVFGILCCSPASAGEGDSSAVVREFQNQLIEVMKTAEKTTVRERFDHLHPGVKKSFHIPLMVQIATGNHWKTATPTERAELVNAFKRMSISTLATLFDSYDGEYFQLTGDKEGPSGTRLVMTELVKSDKSTVDIAYVTRRFREGWRIIDVIVDNGISELKVRRSEYNLVLKNHGIPGLINLLNNKADELMSK